MRRRRNTDDHGHRWRRTAWDWESPPECDEDCEGWDDDGM